MSVDKSETRVQRMFSEIAPRYDFLNHLLSLNIDKYWRWQTVRRVPPQGKWPVLDLCTGTGDLALAYAHRTHCPIVAADFCTEMLAIGRQKAARADLADRITFVEADAQRLPFGDEQFQLVAIAFGLRNVTNTDQGLREMVRVCRPGGRVAILEFSMPRRRPLRSVYGWYFRCVLPRIGQTLARNGSSAYKYLPQSVDEFPSYEALTERMRNAGLEQNQFTPLTFGTATLYVGMKPVGTGVTAAHFASAARPTPLAEPAGQ
jgi:demethylmenaquinone methyltransferase / 2-methoxy-6-polyprenyl-1,4-benzoquinol methylase